MKKKKIRGEQTREEDYEFKSKLDPSQRKSGREISDVSPSMWWRRWNRVEGIRIERCELPPRTDGTVGDGINIRTIRRNRGVNMLTEGGSSFQMAREDVPGLIEHLKKYV